MKVSSLSSRHFMAKDIKRILGIDKNKLFYWIRTYRLLKPDIEEADGTGTRSKFSLKNLLELAIIKELADFKIPLSRIENIKEIIDRIKAVQKKADNGEIQLWISEPKKIKGAKYYNIYEWAFMSKEPFGILIHKGGEDVYAFFTWKVKPITFEDEDDESMQTIEININIWALKERLIRDINKK